MVHLPEGDRIPEEGARAAAEAGRPARPRSKRQDDQEPREWAQRLQQQLRLPLRRDRPGDRPAAGPGPSDPPASGARVLVVEDNVEILELINLQLRDKYRVYVASDGEQGLELAQRERPDLIVTDYMMPEMDGLTMLRRCGPIPSWRRSRSSC